MTWLSLKIIRWKIPIVTTNYLVDLFASRLIPWIQCHTYEKGRVSTDFQKESTLDGNSYYENQEGRPFSFVQVSVQKSGKWIQKDSENLVYLPPILQNCVYE